MFEKKLKLRSFQEIDPSREPVAEKTRIFIKDEGAEVAKVKKPEEWIEMRTGQLLRIVTDNRLGREKRIFRIEVWDREGRSRMAVFDRRTSAERQ